MKKFDINDYLNYSENKTYEYKKIFELMKKNQKLIHDFNGYYSIILGGIRLIRRFLNDPNKKDKIEEWKLAIDEKLIKMKNLLENN